MSEQTTETAFRTWAILELMGHRRLAGYVQEVNVAGAGFLRIDVPASETGWVATQLYAPSAVYAITPVSEETARRVAVLEQPEPVTQWELDRANAIFHPQRPARDREDDEPEDFG